jgi:hypothetical protein
LRNLPIRRQWHQSLVRREFDDRRISSVRLLLGMTMAQRELSIRRLAGDYFASIYTNGEATTA